MRPGHKSYDASDIPIILTFYISLSFTQHCFLGFLEKYSNPLIFRWYALCTKYIISNFIELNPKITSGSYTIINSLNVFNIISSLSNMTILQLPKFFVSPSWNTILCSDWGNLFILEHMIPIVIIWLISGAGNEKSSGGKHSMSKLISLISALILLSIGDISAYETDMLCESLFIVLLTLIQLNPVNPIWLINLINYGMSVS